MLTLLPLSGIQDVFRRRNSTTMEQFADRRGSISVYDTYSLPTSKADMRRFSSYEQLAPFFQQILSQESTNSKPAVPAPAPAPVSPSANSSASTDSSPTVPSPLVRSRRGSISRFTSALTGSFRRQKSQSAKPAVSESDSEVGCDELDAQLAKIRQKLARFKSEDMDMCSRVEDLSSSVEELYASTPECHSPLSAQDDLYSRLRQEKMQMHRSQSFQNYRTCLSSSGLQSISENDSEVDDREDEPEDLNVRAVGEVRLRRSTPVQRSRPSSYALISEEPGLPTPEPVYVSDSANTKSYCLLNNTLGPDTRTKTRSLTQLPHAIRNDLSRHVDTGTSSKRNSVISIMSDSILITHRNLPALQPFLKEHEL